MSDHIPDDWQDILGALVVLRGSRIERLVREYVAGTFTTDSGITFRREDIERITLLPPWASAAARRRVSGMPR